MPNAEKTIAVTGGNSEKVAAVASLSGNFGKIAGVLSPANAEKVGTLLTGNARKVWTYPNLMLDFAGNIGFIGSNSGLASSFLTTTRASVGYSDDSSGVWSSFANNVPRITDKGLLIEESRSNGIRNNSMQGAAAGTPGTMPTNWQTTPLNNLAVTVVGFGTQNGIDYIDVRFNGTTNATSATAVFFDTATGIAGLTAQAWMSSAFVAVVGGSLANINAVRLALWENTAAGAFVQADVGSDLKSTLSSTMRRATQALTTSGGATVGALRPYMDFTYNTTVAIDVTFRIGWPQLELGSFVTSPIRTTNAAVTRAADVVSVTSPPVFGNAYTLYGKGVPAAGTSFASNQFIVAVDDATANNQFILQRFNGTGVARYRSISGGASSANNGAAWAQGVRGSIAAANAASDQSGSFNGGSVFTSAGALPVSVSAMRIGSNNSGSEQFNGYIERVAVFPYRLPNAQLQAITT